MDALLKPTDFDLPLVGPAAVERHEMPVGGEEVQRGRDALEDLHVAHADPRGVADNRAPAHRRHPLEDREEELHLELGVGVHHVHDERPRPRGIAAAQDGQAGDGGHDAADDAVASVRQREQARAVPSEADLQAGGPEVAHSELRELVLLGALLALAGRVVVLGQMFGLRSALFPCLLGLPLRIDWWCELLRPQEQRVDSGGLQQVEDRLGIRVPGRLIGVAQHLIPLMPQSPRHILHARHAEGAAALVLHLVHLVHVRGERPELARVGVLVADQPHQLAGGVGDPGGRRLEGQGGVRLAQVREVRARADPGAEVELLQAAVLVYTERVLRVSTTEVEGVQAVVEVNQVDLSAGLVVLLRTRMGSDRGAVRGQIAPTVPDGPGSAYPRVQIAVAAAGCA
mmetsp:Transcript_21396/g.63851  ORF Transcript_21396/g.63851 Transcript_21396/m.63851 type:complete len:399 (-) Transcript_21396:230-1426(-)